MSSNFESDRDEVEIEFDPDAEATPCAYTDYVRGTDVEDLPATGEGSEGLEREIWDALYEVEDPEMPVSIVDLGLIYGVRIDDRDAEGDGEGSPDDEGETVATVLMTLTYSGCPARKMLTDDVREAAASPDGVDSAAVELVWSPEWTLEMVTEQGKADLREFGLSV